jgi:hypothetical protein
MNSILDNESFQVEERLEMAKILLSMKDKEIAKLKERLSKVECDHDWIIDQAGYHRMGL